MLRRALLGLSRSQPVKEALTRAPVTSRVVRRFVPGETVEDVLPVVSQLGGAGLLATIDHLGEDTTDAARADAVVEAYTDLLDRLARAGMTAQAEVSVKLSALGLHLDGGAGRAASAAARICAAARAAGTTVTLDAEDHTTTDATLTVLAELRTEFPSAGAVLQAYLRRTEEDCRSLSGAGSRVRLCKGAYAEPATVAFTDQAEVDRSYVRCMAILMAGQGYPMLATHDPRLIAIGERLAHDLRRAADTFEFQMLYGIRPTEQQRLANHGYRMRVYVPYGTDWYGYLVRRLAERPANLTFFARSLVSRR